MVPDSITVICNLSPGGVLMFWDNGYLMLCYVMLCCKSGIIEELTIYDMDRNGHLNIQFKRSITDCERSSEMKAGSEKAGKNSALGFVNTFSFYRQSIGRRAVIKVLK